MTTKLRLLPALLTLFLLAGCGTMSPQECQNADWRAIGLRDGTDGEPLSVLDRRTASCAEAGVKLPAPLYLQARDEGLARYCQLGNAARLGLSGNGYQGVCPAGIDAEFRRLHAVGWELNQARSALRSVDARQSDLERRLSKASTDDERKRLREDLRDLDRAVRRARDRVRDAEFNYDRLR
ncbi:MAG: DUF2799 domain-containing protein [Ramlibacter sp.]